MSLVEQTEFLDTERESLPYELPDMPSDGYDFLVAAGSELLRRYEREGVVCHPTFPDWLQVRPGVLQDTDAQPAEHQLAVCDDNELRFDDRSIKIENRPARFLLNMLINNAPRALLARDVTTNPLFLPVHKSHEAKIQQFRRIVTDFNDQCGWPAIGSVGRQKGTRYRIDPGVGISDQTSGVVVTATEARAVAAHYLAGEYVPPRFTEPEVVRQIKRALSEFVEIDEIDDPDAIERFKFLQQQLHDPYEEDSNESLALNPGLMMFLEKLLIGADIGVRLREKGACVGTDVDLFHIRTENGRGKRAVNRQKIADAISVCQMCSVQELCEDFGRMTVSGGSDAGLVVYGGKLFGASKSSNGAYDDFTPDF